MKAKITILVLILAFTTKLSFGQTSSKKAYSKEELAQMHANYKVKKKKG